jgi:hypothetical protein
MAVWSAGNNLRTTAIPTQRTGLCKAKSRHERLNRRRSDRAVRVQTFGRENAADFTAGSKASALFAEMDALLHPGLQTRSGNSRIAP